MTAAMMIVITIVIGVWLCESATSGAVVALMPHGAVIRLEAYSLKTAYYSTPGGMQIDRTPERVDASARELVRRYPLLCKLNTAKKSGKTEVRLVDPKKRRVLA